jgi:hypothetical protein
MEDGKCYQQLKYLIQAFFITRLKKHYKHFLILLIGGVRARLSNVFVEIKDYERRLCGICSCFIQDDVSAQFISNCENILEHKE